MLGNEYLYHPKKLKLTKQQWSILKECCHSLDIHHEMGKDYEGLCCLRAIEHEQHLRNHHKYIHGIPYARAILNLAYWVQVLGDQFEYFSENNLLGI